MKRFSAAGWRVITCSRHPFPENCPWEAGPEDHIQVDLASPSNTEAAVKEIKRRLKGELHALVNNAGISPKAAGGGRLGSIATAPEAGSMSSSRTSSRRSCWRVAWSMSWRRPKVPSSM